EHCPLGIAAASQARECCPTTWSSVKDEICASAGTKNIRGHWKISGRRSPMKRRTGRVPEEFHTITPHLCVRGVGQAVEFYREAFGAQELYRTLATDNQRVRHCEMLLGDSRFFLVDESPAWGGIWPLMLGGAAVTLQL